MADSSESSRRRPSAGAAGPAPDGGAQPPASAQAPSTGRPPGPAAAAARRALPQRPNAAADPPEELLLVGRVVAAQGLSGELRVQPLSDFPERFTTPGRRWLRRRGEPVRCWQLLSGRPLPGRELFVLRLATIDDRTAAEALVGAELLVAAADRPALAAGEFHLLDLVGLEVRLLPEGRAIGRVENLIHAGQDLLEISLEPTDQLRGDAAAGSNRSAKPARRLIPFVHAIVPEVHPTEGWLGITPPPGLLELETS